MCHMYIPHHEFAIVAIEYILEAAIVHLDDTSKRVHCSDVCSRLCRYVNQSKLYGIYERAVLQMTYIGSKTLR